MSTIVTRAGKGSALTHNEVDANFVNLNNDKLQSGDTATALTITTATVGSGTAAAPAITTSGDTNTGIFFPAADTIALTEGGVERMRLDSAGNVGIGTTSPSFVTSYTGLQVNNPGGTGGTTIKLTNSTTGTTSADGFDLIVGNNSSDAYVWQRETAPLIFGTNNTERMRIDSAGNVGIGTTAASTGLRLLRTPVSSTDYFNNSIASFESDTSDGLAVVRTGTTTIGFKVNTSRNLVFGTEAASGGFTERMRIDSSGRLLVGAETARTNFAGNTTTPSFQIEGAAAGTAAASIVRDQAGSSGAVFNFGKTRGAAVGDNTVVVSGDQLGIINFQGADGTNLLAAASIQAAVDGTPGTNDMPGRLVFSTTADGASSSTERMRIDSAGNVGIGTSSPSGKLNVQDSVAAGRANITLLNNAAGNTSNRMRIRMAASSGFSGTDLYPYIEAYEENAANAAEGLAFGTYNGTSLGERMRIDSSGNLLVGTTSGTTNRFVKDASGGIALQASNTSTTTTSSAMELNVNYTGGTSGWFVRGGDNASYRFYIYSNGNMANSNNSYGAISDAKLKENVTDATPKLEKLQQVRVVNYNLIGQEQKQLGVIAQELEQIFPGMVDESPDRDADGNDLGTTTKSVKYSVFVPMLIKAIQEQQAMIEELKAKVAALENK